MAELLAGHTTFRLGGPARSFVEVTSEDDFISAVRQADAAGEPVLVLAGGSNMLIGDDGFAGTVVKVATKGITVQQAGAEVLVTAAAGEYWDNFVAMAVAHDWVGIEALSGIPGCVGSTAIQNVGAYGQEVAGTIESVRTWDRTTRDFVTFDNQECQFGYRDSRFKREPGRYLVLEVTFRFRCGATADPLRFGELRRRLQQDDQLVPISAVRETVLELRRGKGMVIDPDDPDTWSAGSFFTNPIITTADAQSLPAAAPRYPQPDGRVKTSAAWLIEHAGFAKGYGRPPATLSTKHTLALTNRGAARTADVLALAREIRAGVKQAFGIDLVPEPVLVNCSLD